MVFAGFPSRRSSILGDLATHVMKTTSSAWFVFLAFALIPGSNGADTLGKREVKKFKGTYEGEISGIAGNASLPNNSTRFNAQVKVTGKSRERLPALISELNADPSHTIVWRQPTGTNRRVKWVGLYVGTVTNPLTLLPEPVSGTRTLIIVDRGRDVNFRYIMRLTDTLREGSYSAQNLKGKLGRRR